MTATDKCGVGAGLLALGLAGGILLLAQLLVDVTFNDGRASFEVTFATAGPQTLTITDTGDKSLTGTATTSVTDPAATDGSNASPTAEAVKNVKTPAAVRHFAVTLPPNVRKGEAVSVEAAVLDAQNQPLRNYTGTVNVTSSDGGVILPGGIYFFPQFLARPLSVPAWFLHLPHRELVKAEAIFDGILCVLGLPLGIYFLYKGAISGKGTSAK